MFILLGNNLMAQTYEELLQNTSFEKDISKRLPPLNELQQSAIEHSPIFKMLDADVNMGEYKILEERREWMRSLGIEGGAKYGLFDNLILSEGLGGPSLVSARTEQTRYYFGFFMKVPLSTIADKSNVKTAIAEKDKLRFQREAKIQELRQLIIMQYGTVIKEHRGILIKNDAVESYRVQMLKAETDYSNGKINISEYARLDDMLSKAVLALEHGKVDFLTAFMMLEEIVGVKIELKN